MEDSSRNNEEKKSIDEILYFVKEKEFDEEIIKRDLGLDIIINRKYDGESGVIVFEGEVYRIQPQSRNITFDDGQKSIVKFVCNSEHLKKILNELQFNVFNTDIDEEKESIDSLNSEDSKSEINNIFKNKDIKKIFKDKPDLEKLIDKFK